MVVDRSKWTCAQEQLVKRWCQTTKTYAIMHSLCANDNALWRRAIGIPTVLIGAVTASSIFSAAESSSTVWQYINGALALSVTALSGISNFLNLDEKITKHRAASIAHTRLSYRMECMLSRPRAQRDDVVEFTTSCRKEISDIQEGMVDVSSGVMNKYMNKFDKSIVNTSVIVNAQSDRQHDTQHDIQNDVQQEHGRGVIVPIELNEPPTFDATPPSPDTNIEDVMIGNASRKMFECSERLVAA